MKNFLFTSSFKIIVLIFLFTNFNVNFAYSKKIINKISNENNFSNTPINFMPKLTVIANQENENYYTESSASSMKINKKLQDTPQTINIVNSSQILDRNIVNLEESSRYIPAFYVKQGEGNRDQISIRGNDSTADFFVDGVRDDMQYFRDFYNVEQIEVLKGPNALAFGRGGSGGLINRISKTANGSIKRQINLNAGSFENRRLQTDIAEKINNKISMRFNGVYEKSRTFRDYGNLEKFGINPSFLFKINNNTDIKFGYENFYDNRFNDRGLPSYNGAPLKISSSKFVGNPNENKSIAQINSFYVILNHEFANNLSLKNYSKITHYDKYYKNAFANSAVNNLGNFKISAYDNDQQRFNFINQTDLIKKFNFGNVKHELLTGFEVIYQNSKLIRKNGFFDGKNDAEISIFNNSLNFEAVDYRLANSNRNNVNVLASYAQDNIILNKYFEINLGVRLDHFKINFTDNILNKKFQNIENFFAPKFALIFKPKTNLSTYVSYSNTYLPNSGDQFNDVSKNSIALKAEKIQNYEIGAKYAVNDKINFNTALFILDRKNSRANDPNGSGFFVATGSSRTKGLEISADGELYKKLKFILSFSHLDARITNNVFNANKNKKLALTPKNKSAIWLKYDIDSKYAVGAGFINQSSQFASIDNSVKIKGFNRFDTAIYYKINEKLKTQINIENLFNKKYIMTAHNNNNIQPGSVRFFKANLIMDF